MRGAGLGAIIGVMKRAFFLTLLAWAASCTGATLHLVVRNGADADQADGPVTAGVPWPVGALRSHDALRLLDTSGAERPLQVEALSRWPDGSLKWTLLDFQASVRRKGSATYHLDYGLAGAQRQAPASPLSVREDSALITVSTGAARFRLAKDRFRLFDEVTLEGQDRPLVAPHGDEDGLSLEFAEPQPGARPRVFLSSRGPAKAQVETKGPVRVVVRIEGKLQAADGATAGDYVARLYFAAGRPAARLQLTVFNRDPASPPLPVQDLTVRLPLHFGGLLKWDFAGEAGRHDTHPGSLRAPADHAELVQVCGGSSETCRYEVVQRNETMASGKAAWGGVSLWGSAGGGAAVAVRQFAPNSPKSLRVFGRPRIEVGLFPREAGPCKDFLPGRAKTHDVLFWFSPGEPPSVPSLCAALDGPLAACVATPEEPDPTGEWYAAAGAFPLAARGSGDYERGFPADLDRLLAATQGQGAWGVWNHGAALCQPFDPTLALCREFLRRGDPLLLDAAHTAARHLADVATFHNVAGGAERLNGACRIPDSNPQSATQSWYAGAWLVALLTGDRVVLDAAFKNAAFATRHADDSDAPPLAAALAVLNLTQAADLAPAFAPGNTEAFATALDAYLGKLLDARDAAGAIGLEALAACQARKPDPRIAPAMLHAAEALSQLKTKAWGIAASPALPWLAWAAATTGDFRFLAEARRIERVASLAQCQTPLDFAMRYRGGDLFAAAWERYATKHPRPPGEAIGLQCHLESAADVALPSIGVGGAVLSCPFVALPNGTRGCLVLGPGAKPEPILSFPLVESGNSAETQGAIEFRLLWRKGPCDRQHPLLASGDPHRHGFQLSASSKTLVLFGRYERSTAFRIAAPTPAPTPQAWHHLAISWQRATGLHLFLNGQKVGHSASSRLALGPLLQFPCGQDQADCECIVRDLRIWRRPPDSFPAASDTTPPTAVTDLLLAPADEGRMLLSWTAPSDPAQGRPDGKPAKAHRYDIRFWTEPPAGLEPAGGYDAEWAEADRIAAPRPATPGQLERLVIGPLPAGRRSYVALRAEDEAGNISPISNVATVKP